VAVLWMVTLRSMIEVYQFQRYLLPASSPWWQSQQAPQEHQNTSTNYMPLQTRKQPSSYLLPWEPEILLEISHCFQCQVQTKLPLLWDHPSARSEMKPLTYSKEYDKVLPSQGFCIPCGTVIEEYGYLLHSYMRVSNADQQNKAI
jgi:hypothetical protein